MAKPEGMITVQEAARRLGRSIEQVRRYLREGKLRGERIGQQWFIEDASLASLSVRYRVRKPRTSQIREVAAVMETGKELRSEIEALIREVDASREAICSRLGHDLDIDVVEMLRIDREEH